MFLRLRFEVFWRTTLECFRWGSRAEKSTVKDEVKVSSVKAGTNVRINCQRRGSLFLLHSEKQFLNSWNDESWGKLSFLFYLFGDMTVKKKSVTEPGKDENQEYFMACISYEH